MDPAAYRSLAAAPDSPPSPPRYRSLGAGELQDRFFTAPSGTEPRWGFNAHEKKWKRPVDVVLCLDVTGSMDSYLHRVKKTISTVAAQLNDVEHYNVRFGMVAYRDHPQHDYQDAFVTKTYKLTEKMNDLQKYLSEVSAKGGGDGPEAVEAGLAATLDLDWRADAAKMCFLIGDAPPHGLGEVEDAFPRGIPHMDPFVVLDKMAARGITIYAVGCEDVLSEAYHHGTDFWIAAAKKTGGRAIALRSAGTLDAVILGGIMEEMDLLLVRPYVKDWVMEVRAQQRNGLDLDPEDFMDMAFRSLLAAVPANSRCLKAATLASKTSPYACEAKTLAEARQWLCDAKFLTPLGAKRSVEAQGGAAVGVAVDNEDMATQELPLSEEEWFDDGNGGGGGGGGGDGGDDDDDNGRTHRVPFPMDTVWPRDPKGTIEPASVGVEEAELSQDQFARLFQQLVNTKQIEA